MARTATVGVLNGACSPVVNFFLQLPCVFKMFSWRTVLCLIRTPSVAEYRYSSSCISGIDSGTSMTEEMSYGWAGPRDNISFTSSTIIRVLSNK